MLYFDAPYGLLHEEHQWDQQITVIDGTNILKQFLASQNSEKCVMFWWHKPRDSQIVQDIFTSGAYQEAQHLFWYKPSHYTQTPVSSYTSTVEMGTIAFTPSRQQSSWNMPHNPRSRHNHLQIPALTRYARDANMIVINPCQKPPELSKTIISNHVPPGENVLVVGGGACGDIIGALQAGVNVVSVERDERQFLEMEKILLDAITEEKALMQQEAANLVAQEASFQAQEAEDAAGGEQAAALQGQGVDSPILPLMYCPDCGDVFKDGDDRTHKCILCGHGRPLHTHCLQVGADGLMYCQTHHTAWALVADAAGSLEEL